MHCFTCKSMATHDALAPPLDLSLQREPGHGAMQADRLGIGAVPHSTHFCTRHCLRSNQTLPYACAAGATEEDYYLGEYSAEERAAGIADVALNFANESKSQRGVKALAREAAAAAKTVE